jgi:hypothetical protein
LGYSNQYYHGWFSLSNGSLEYASIDWKGMAFLAINDFYYMVFCGWVLRDLLVRGFKFEGKAKGQALHFTFLNKFPNKFNGL